MWSTRNRRPRPPRGLGVAQCPDHPRVSVGAAAAELGEGEGRGRGLVPNLHHPDLPPWPRAAREGGRRPRREGLRGDVHPLEGHPRELLGHAEVAAGHRGADADMRESGIEDGAAVAVVGRLLVHHQLVAVLEQVHDAAIDESRRRAAAARSRRGRWPPPAPADVRRAPCFSRVPRIPEGASQKRSPTSDARARNAAADRPPRSRLIRSAGGRAVLPRVVVSHPSGRGEADRGRRLGPGARAVRRQPPRARRRAARRTPTWEGDGVSVPVGVEDPKPVLLLLEAPVVGGSLRVIASCRWGCRTRSSSGAITTERPVVLEVGRSAAAA